MNLLRKYLAITFAAASLCMAAKPTILSLADHVNDSTIVFPESVETDTHKLMQNWYLRNYTALDKEVATRPDVHTTDQEIIKRLQAIPTTIEMPFNSIVRAYIDMYTGKKRGLVETMLGMSLYYMPIFESAIEREGLPMELKYLPVIESALDPNAVSRAGATGLWQIMVRTAKGLGLEVSTLVDERRDPIRSSEAATKYLRQLHDIYNDWSLAIAAYNCGPGNVNKAMRRAGEEGKDFWSIYPYLPRETRGYVPCFIAATYVMNYYHLHNISPALAKRPLLTDSVHVNKRVHFKQISEVLQIPEEQLQLLNPQYRKQQIPGDIKNYSLVLPANQTYSYIMSEDAIVGFDAKNYARRDIVEPSDGIEPRRDIVDGKEGEWVTTEDIIYHKVRRRETMASIARKYGVTLRSLKRANGNIRKPKRGQTLKVVTTKREFHPFETETELLTDTNLLSQEETTATNATDSIASTNNVAAITIEAADTTDKAHQAHDKVAETFRSSKANRIADNETDKTELANNTKKVADTKPARETKKKNNDKASKKSKNNSSKKYHTVRRGESLYVIAQKNHTTVKKLRDLNGIRGNKIKPGDKLRVK